MTSFRMQAKEAFIVHETTVMHFQTSMRLYQMFQKVEGDLFRRADQWQINFDIFKLS